MLKMHENAASILGKIDIVRADDSQYKRHEHDYDNEYTDEEHGEFSIIFDFLQWHRASSVPTFIELG